MGNVYRIDIADVDLLKPFRRENTGTLLAEGDMVANRFGAKLRKGNEPCDCGGHRVTGYFINPHGETIIIDGKTDEDYVFVDLPSACYASEGSFSLAIKVALGGSAVTVRAVDGYIRLTSTDHVIDPTDKVYNLSEMLTEMNDLEKITMVGVDENGVEHTWTMYGKAK